jgi:hypothetical protein
VVGSGQCGRGGTDCARRLRPGPTRTRPFQGRQKRLSVREYVHLPAGYVLRAHVYIFSAEAPDGQYARQRRAAGVQGVPTGIGGPGELPAERPHAQAPTFIDDARMSSAGNVRVRRSCPSSTSTASCFRAGLTRKLELPRAGTRQHAVLPAGECRREACIERRLRPRTAALSNLACTLRGRLNQQGSGQRTAAVARDRAVRARRQPDHRHDNHCPLIDALTDRVARPADAVAAAGRGPQATCSVFRRRRRWQALAAARSTSVATARCAAVTA